MAKDFFWMSLMFAKKSPLATLQYSSYFTEHIISLVNILPLTMKKTNDAKEDTSPLVFMASRRLRQRHPTQQPQQQPEQQTVLQGAEVTVQGSGPSLGPNTGNVVSDTPQERGQLLRGDQQGRGGGDDYQGLCLRLSRVIGILDNVLEVVGDSGAPDEEDDAYFSNTPDLRHQTLSGTGARIISAAGSTDTGVVAAAARSRRRGRNRSTTVQNNPAERGSNNNHPQDDCNLSQ